MPYDVTKKDNKQDYDVRNTIFLTQVNSLTVCGPQVDTLILYKRLECPTFFKKPRVLND